MSDRGDYRELARQCVREAEATEAPETKAFLLMMAQAWMKLADKAEKKPTGLINKILGLNLEL